MRATLATSLAMVLALQMGAWSADDGRKIPSGAGMQSLSALLPYPEAGPVPAAVAYGNPASSPLRLSAAVTGSGSLRIKYDLPGNLDISLQLFGLEGGEAVVLAAGAHRTGKHVVYADARSWPRGVYVLRLQAEGRSLSRRVVIAR
jgi:hypothetical protein